MFGIVAIVLQHEMDVSAFFDCAADLSGHLVEECRVRNGMYGIEAQAVEAVFHQPVEGVLDEEASYRRLPKIDGSAPRCVDIVAEEVRRIAAEIIAVWPEVIVDDVEEYHLPTLVRGVDQRLEIIGRTVGTIRCER